MSIWKQVADQFEEIVACAALISVILSVSWSVITRYFTSQPAAWASEVATLSFAWVVFFGATACIKYKLHPSIDMLVVRLPLTWLYAPMAFCFALMALRYLRVMIRGVQDIEAERETYVG